MQAHELSGAPWHHPVFWVAIAFVLFFVLFGRKIWGALTSKLDSYADEVRQNLDEARKLRREAEAMLEDARRRKEQALAEAKRLLESAHAEAGRAAQALSDDAEASIRRREKMANDRIAAAEKAAVDEVRFAAADIASRAAKDILAREFGPYADAALIDSAISKLPQALRAA
ncbi:F0F1 ATP synthase subunit B family protein [Granulibacter bethesdensis]|uniref:F0F1 ATP synthase subunit B family protein n=1 Tax=Granulibacter bethesdensis TaxID=364410 RepID=UPI0003F1CC6D|nr:ATP synthase subunit B [Granulibacter bethesdensis]AHJ65673.1 ATP synthase B chain [Granulibacter bethesdensis CGDNIH4]